MSNEVSMIHLNTTPDQAEAVVPRAEFPRPDRERAHWLCLNGTWEFSFGDDAAADDPWPVPPALFDRRIIVPFCFQSPASGVGLADERHDVLWYRRRFGVGPDLLPRDGGGRRLHLHFGAVDWEARVWLNGHYLGRHQGGYSPFHFDVTRFVQAEENQLVVQAIDRFDCSQPRGKQNWGLENWGCWYAASSGIWQPVWLEALGPVAVSEVYLTPDIDRGQVAMEVQLDGLAPDLVLETEISFEGRVMVAASQRVGQTRMRQVFPLDEPNAVDESHYWWPESPRLFTVRLRLAQKTGDGTGAEFDQVRSYFGMRKISVSGDHILINNRRYYQRLILNQAYWTESLITPPSDQAIITDIELAKQLGFNGMRLHQKIEDPRFYYHADRLGMLVWGEMPSAYQFGFPEIANVTDEWQRFIKRDYNHPCIVTWVPLNESWGVRNIYRDARQQAFALALYQLTKALDGTRLVSGNDGWEMVDSDFIAIHDYEPSGAAFAAKAEAMEKTLAHSFSSRMMLAEGVSYRGQPILVTEFGGIAFADGPGTWGYFGAVGSEAEFLGRFAGIVGAIQASPRIEGFCYTQLCDVFQEANGLLTMDRRPKVPIERVRAIILGQQGAAT